MRKTGINYQNLQEWRIEEYIKKTSEAIKRLAQMVDE